MHSGSNKLAMNVPLTNSSTTVVPRQRPRGSAKTAGNSIVASTVVVSGKTTVPLPPLPSPSQPKAGKNLNVDKEVLFIEVSLKCYLEGIFSSCKV